MNRRAALIVVVVVALTAVTVFTARATRHREPAVDVTTSDVTKGPIVRQVLASSTLEAARSVDVGSQISGTILSVDVDFNSVVRRGQVLARIDPSSYETQLAGARAAMAKASADSARLRALLEDARVKHERSQALLADRLIPTTELDAARLVLEQAAADLKRSDADVQAAEAEQRAAQVSLERTIIRSPIDGVVVNRSVDVGQTFAVRVESPVLFTIADLRHMKLLVEVNEAEVGGIQPGTPVSFQVETLGPQPFDGQVANVRLQPYSEAAATSGTSTSGATAVATSGVASTTSTQGAGSTPPAASSGSAAATTVSNTSAVQSGPAAPGVVTYTAVVDVDNPDGRLIPGGTAIVTLAGSQRREAVRVPNNALTFSPDVDVLEAVGQTMPPSDAGEPRDAVDRSTQQARVWRYDNGRFVPVAIRIGIADDQWTEVVGGALRPGDRVVTRAAARQNR